jgi:hypothetical protein
MTVQNANLAKRVLLAAFLAAVVSIVDSVSLPKTAVAGFLTLSSPCTTRLCLKQTVVVSPAGTGSDAVANGSVLLSALAGIRNPSAANAYLLKIEPGIYDVGNKPVVMRQYVDIEGSGEDITVIRGTTSGDLLTGIVNGADHSELRFVTVEGNDIAVHTQGATMQMVRVTAIASGSPVARAIFAQPRVLSGGSAGNRLSLVDVTALAPDASDVDGAGVSIEGYTSVDLVNVEASGRAGVFVVNGTVTIRNAVLRGTEWSLLVDLGLANVAATQLDGPVANPYGHCVGAYDGNFKPLSDQCQ